MILSHAPLSTVTYVISCVATSPGGKPGILGHGRGMSGPLTISLMLLLVFKLLIGLTSPRKAPKNQTPPQVWGNFRHHYNHTNQSKTYSCASCGVGGCPGNHLVSFSMGHPRPPRAQGPAPSSPRQPFAHPAIP